MSYKRGSHDYPSRAALKAAGAAGPPPPLPPPCRRHGGDAGGCVPQREPLFDEGQGAALLRELARVAPRPPRLVPAQVARLDRCRGLQEGGLRLLQLLPR
eukprot:5237906-Prymnesium_polylepis.1